MGNPLCGHPRASEGSFPSAFSPAVSPLLFPRLSAAAPTAGEIGARPDFLCGPAAARATRRPGPRGATNCTCGGPGRPGWHSASLATPLHPALSSRPLRPAPSQSGFQRQEKASPPRGFRINRVTRGRAGPALGPRGWAEGGGVVGRVGGRGI